MKKTTVKYHLDEDEIKEAIREWPGNNHGVYDAVDVTLNVEYQQKVQADPPANKGDPYRGASFDCTDAAVFTAVAEEG